MGSSASPRRYGGVSAEERVAQRRARLIEAGLDVMGTRGIAALTVRGLAEETGLAARYVYESFPSLDDLQLAVFDRIAEEALHRSFAALASVPAGEDGDTRTARTRAVLAEMVDLLLEDPRKGRVLLVEASSSPVLGPRVLAEARRFAGFVAATASSGDPLGDSEQLPADVRVAAQFLIGGMGSAVGAVLQGDITMSREQLVDVLVRLFTAVDHAGDDVLR